MRNKKLIKTLLCVGFDHLATKCIEQELEADGFVIIGTSSIPNAVKLTTRPVPDNILLNIVPTGIDMKAIGESVSRDKNRGSHKSIRWLFRGKD
jgi:hypothetical protein